MLNLPQQVARFVEATEENFRQNRELIQQVREQIREIQKQNRLMYQQLDRLEGRTGNFDRAVYERRARIMSLASGVQAVGVVATDRLHGSQESLAKDRGVTVLTCPNR